MCSAQIAFGEILERPDAFWKGHHFLAFPSVSQRNRETGTGRPIVKNQNLPWPWYFRKSIAIHLPFLTRCFYKSTPPPWQEVVYTPPMFRGPQMGGQIRRGWIWRFRGAPIFRPEVPKPFRNRYLGTSGLEIGVPRKRQTLPRKIWPASCGPLKCVSRCASHLYRDAFNAEVFRGRWNNIKMVTRPQLGPFLVLKFVRSRGFGVRFLQLFPESLATIK